MLPVASKWFVFGSKFDSCSSSVLIAQINKEVLRDLHNVLIFIHSEEMKFPEPWILTINLVSLVVLVFFSFSKNKDQAILCWTLSSVLVCIILKNGNNARHIDQN